MDDEPLALGTIISEDFVVTHIEDGHHKEKQNEND